MNYLILIYANASNWQHPLFLEYEEHTEDERAELHAEFDAYFQTLWDTRTMLAGGPLEAPQTTKTLTERNGQFAVTDGPFAESKEHLAGFAVVDCETIDEAVEIARHYPDIKYSAVEVRPLASWMTTASMRGN